MHPLDNYQARFDRRWGTLRHARVRALAWLLDAPDLLDTMASAWHDKIMTLGPVDPALERWLFALDHDPAALDSALGTRPFTRLGLYAEKLMAFYFQAQGRLVAHGLQVRASRNDTVGEFDFLLDAGDGVAHVEFATKFYLLRDGSDHGLDALVGPNLADSLGVKMRKIVERQLVLGQHPAAQAVLARPVLHAHALVKGWLFHPLAAYVAARPGGLANRQEPAGALAPGGLAVPDGQCKDGAGAGAVAAAGAGAGAANADDSAHANANVKVTAAAAADAAADPAAGDAFPGVAPAHCRGFWCALDEFDALDALGALDAFPAPGANCYLILPKLQWLAPYRSTSADGVMTRAGLHAALSARFDSAADPVLVAVLRQRPGHVVETERGFIVPPAWRTRATTFRVK